MTNSQAATGSLNAGGPSGLSGQKVISAIESANISYVLSVPDLHTSAGLLQPMANQPGLRIVRVCKEDECFGIAAGLSFASKRALILIQYTGLLYAANAIRAISVEQQMPTCIMVGLLGKEPGIPPNQSGRMGVRFVEPLLQTMGIRHHLIETDDDIGIIAPEVEAAYADPHPVAFLIGRRPA